MLISAFITITRPEERGDTFKECLKSAEGFADEVIIVDGKDTWPQEFNWPLIGEHFQKGYEQAKGDWVFHLDTDFIFHQRDYGKIRQACKDYPTSPAVSFYKWQFILPDRYNLKSRLVLAVNKTHFQERIKFNGGGDLCQPTLDNRDLDLNEIPQSGVAFYNYEKLIKTEAQIKEDVGRMARAWKLHFGEYKLGGPDDESAYAEWLYMARGRFNKPQERLPFDYHPAVMHDTINNLTPDKWGYNGFGLIEGKVYA